jgi:hypothetical protein
MYCYQILPVVFEFVLPNRLITKYFCDFSHFFTMFTTARALASVTGDAWTLVTAVQTSSTIVEVL